MCDVPKAFGQLCAHNKVSTEDTKVVYGIHEGLPKIMTVHSTLKSEGVSKEIVVQFRLSGYALGARAARHMNNPFGGL